jgi:GTP pyrophosphokinase
LLALIGGRFGERVRDVVESCSETLERPKPPWAERKAAYLVHLEGASDSALRVSLADKLYNASSILRDYRLVGEEVWCRFNAGKDDTIQYYRDLAIVFERRSTSPMAEELARIVGDLVEISRP